MSLLLALILGAGATAIAGAVCSIVAANVKNKRSEITDMLEQSLHSPTRPPDNAAGDAMTLSLINQENTRVAAKDAADARPWNVAAACLGVASAVLSLGAGLIAAG